jgi:hypothetical protein
MIARRYGVLFFVPAAQFTLFLQFHNIQATILAHNVTNEHHMQIVPKSFNRQRKKECIA